MCIVLHCEKLASVYRHGSHSFRLQLHHTCLYLVKHSPDGATTDSDNSRLIAAYYRYSFIDPKRMKLLHDELHWLTSLSECSTSLLKPVTVHRTSGIKHRPDIPHRLLRSSYFRRCRSPAPANAIRQPPSTDCSTCPLQHLPLSLHRFCWSYRLQSGIQFTV